jgi:hypothetical protein
MSNYPQFILKYSPSFFLCVLKGYSTLREGIRVLCGESLWIFKPYLTASTHRSSKAS